MLADLAKALLTQWLATVDNQSIFARLMRALVTAVINIATFSTTTPVVFRPGVPSSGNAFATWPEVMARLSLSGLVAIDDRNAPAIVPVGTWDVKNNQFYSAYLSAPAGATLTLADGAVLHDFGGNSLLLQLVCQPTTGPCLTFTPAPAGKFNVLISRFGANLINQGTVPAVEVPDNTIMAFEGNFSGGFTAAGPAPVVHLGVNSGAIGIPFIVGIFSTNWVTGPASASILYVQASADFVPPSVPGFLGGQSVSYVENAGGVNYVDTAPLLGSTNVQGAIDALKALIGGAAFAGQLTQVPLGNANTTYDTTSLIPANAKILWSRVTIISPYTATTSISGGQAGSPTLLVSPTDVPSPQIVGPNDIQGDVAWGGAAAKLRGTVAGNAVGTASALLEAFWVPQVHT